MEKLLKLNELTPAKITVNDIKEYDNLEKVINYISLKSEKPKMKQKDVCNSLGFSVGKLSRTLKELDSTPLHKPNFKSTGKKDWVTDPQTGKRRDRNSKSWKNEFGTSNVDIINTNTSNTSNTPVSKIPKKSKGWKTGGNILSPEGTTEDLGTSENPNILFPGAERTIDENGKPIYKFDPEENTGNNKNPDMAKYNQVISNMRK